MNGGRAASIRARLLALARKSGEDFNLVLNRYAIERFLYRISISRVRDAFVLKGATLFDLWFGVPHRATRDADFLGFGAEDAEALRRTLQELCSIEADDGLVFDPRSVVIEEIRENARYGGLRARLVAHLGSARCTAQIDVGYGDAVTPAPEEAVCPVLLDDLPAPRLRVYPRATVMAEKLEAIISLGMANSRMKDYFDLLALIQEGEVTRDQVLAAIAATFKRRDTPLPDGVPVGLSMEFARDPAKLAQWRGFLGRNRLQAPALDAVVATLREYFAVPLAKARQRHQQKQQQQGAS